MSDHACQALVIHCIDYRLQKSLNDWLGRRFGLSDYDRVSLAGGVFDFSTILKQVEISDRLHKIQKVILINHEDCGAYGQESTPERHAHDLMQAEREIEALFPHLDVEIYYMHLNGILEQLSRTNSS
jgi:carbonic anhydrase